MDHCPIILIGESHVGKTALFKSLTNVSVGRTNYVPTFGVNIGSRVCIKSSGRQVKFQLFDTAGHDEWRRCNRFYLKKLHDIRHFMLVCDLSNPYSVGRLNYLHNEIKRNDTRILVIFNTLDKWVEDIQDEAIRWCRKQNLPWLMVDKTDDGCHQALLSKLYGEDVTFLVPSDQDLSCSSPVKVSASDESRCSGLKQATPSPIVPPINLRDISDLKASTAPKSPAPLPSREEPRNRPSHDRSVAHRQNPSHPFQAKGAEIIADSACERQHMDRPKPRVSTRNERTVSVDHSTSTSSRKTESVLASVLAKVDKIKSQNMTPRGTLPTPSPVTPVTSAISSQRESPSRTIKPRQSAQPPERGTARITLDRRTRIVDDTTHIATDQMTPRQRLRLFVKPETTPETGETTKVQRSPARLTPSDLVPCNTRLVQTPREKLMMSIQSRSMNKRTSTIDQSPEAGRRVPTPTRLHEALDDDESSSLLQLSSESSE